MIDERGLALRGARWPAPLIFHAQLLAELEVLRPRGILLDFLLIDPAPRQDTCELFAVGARLRHEGIPLYLAVTESADLEAMDGAGCRDAAGAPLRAVQVFTPVSVQRQVDGSDFVGRRYPFEQRAAGTPAGSGTVSAAVRMYCDGERAPESCLRRLTPRPAPGGGGRGGAAGRVFGAGARAPESGVRRPPAGGAREAGLELGWPPGGAPFNQRWPHAWGEENRSRGGATLNQRALPRESPCPPV